MNRRWLALPLLLAAVAARAQPAPDDFELLPPAKAEVPAEAAPKLEEELHQRRTMLWIHQATGLTMLAAMGTTAVLGQLEYSDKYAGGGDTGQWHAPHQVAAYSTAVLFTGAGMLALLAPAPMERTGRIDTVTVHKIAMATATAGMIAQVVLGIAAARNDGAPSQRDFALAHQIIGYGTLAATATGFFALTF